jgi:hypothetical protein
MKFLIVTFLLYFSCSYSQINIIDSQTKEKISFVDIYNENDVFIGSTNDKLFIDNELKNRILKQSNFVTIKAAFYEQRKLVIEEFINLKEIFLEKKVYQLDEVIVKNDQNKKYLKITGYYRSTQINNSEIQYFNDGEVTYYIDKKNKNILPHYQTNRSFENKEIKQISKNLNFSVVGPPNISDYQQNKPLIQNTIKNNSFIEINTVYFDSLRTKEMNFLGNKSILSEFTSKKIYSDSVNIENLLYYKEFRTYKVKKKKDIKFTTIESIHEFYVTDISFTDSKEKQNCRFYVFNRKKEYDLPFWKNINNTLFQQDNLVNQKLDVLFKEIND